ncbi:MAG: serine protease, partial [Pseudomonadota bacterium]|nr:serine protease [Pseudomonadota bacterium]
MPQAMRRCGRGRFLRGGTLEYLDIARAAAERWHERRGVRDPNVAKIDRGMAIEAESVERIHARIHLLSEATQVVNREQSLIAAAAAGGNVRPLTEAIGLERVIGKKDFLDANFMEIGLAVARFVGRINIRSDSGRSIGYGTGFMVSPRLLLTNNHVLGSADEARASEVEFDYQNDRQGRLLPLVGFGLDPDAFFMTDKKLDFTLVAVREVSAGGLPLRRYGWSRLIGATGKALLGESLNIIQHPRGEPKQIVLRSNELVDLFDQFAQYRTDTEPGSSGSPVYNDQWELVALHHSGVPKTDANGNLLDKDGKIWTDDMDPDKLEWVANEGIRVSRLVDYIK